jgi:hypothetical protein
MVDDPFNPIKEHTLQQNEELFYRTGAAALNLHHTYADDAKKADDMQANNMKKLDPE